MDTREIGEKLVALCSEGQNIEAIDTLYGADIVSVEAQGSDQMPAVMTGIDAIRDKNNWWLDNHEVHYAAAEGPMVNGDRFSVIFDYEMTPKSGPQAGQRSKMHEVAVYTVDDGKIVREEFFY